MFSIFEKACFRNDTYIHVCMHAYMHACIHVNISTHTYMHTYIQRGDCVSLTRIYICLCLNRFRLASQFWGTNYLLCVKGLFNSGKEYKQKLVYLLRGSVPYRSVQFFVNP